MNDLSSISIDLPHGMLRNFLVKQLKSIAVIANKLLYRGNFAEVT